jgi:hypothetical protein
MAWRSPAFLLNPTWPDSEFSLRCIIDIPMIFQAVVTECSEMLAEKFQHRYFNPVQCVRFPSFKRQLITTVRFHERDSPFLFLDFRVRNARAMPVQMNSMHRTRLSDALNVIRNNAERCLCGLRGHGLAEARLVAMVDLRRLRNQKMFQI